MDQVADVVHAQFRRIDGHVFVALVHVLTNARRAAHAQQCLAVLVRDEHERRAAMLCDGDGLAALDNVGRPAEVGLHLGGREGLHGDGS